MTLLATNILPINISVKYSEYVDAYIDAKRNFDQTSLTFLIKAMHPTFKRWSKIFQSKQYEKDITIYTLIRLLKADNKPEMPIAWKIKSIKDWMSASGITFYELCQEAFISHIRKETVVHNNYPTELSFFFFIAKDVKMFLFKQIRHILQKLKKDYKTNFKNFYQSNKFIDLYLDINYIENIQTTNYLLFGAYILFITKKQVTIKDLKKAFGLNNQEAKELKEALCQLTKTVLLSN